METKKERSISEIIINNNDKIPKNKFNEIVSVSGLYLIFLPLAFGPFDIKQIIGITDILSVLYATLLGFIIAGYTIFTTAGNPRFLSEIWKHVDSRSGLPLLKIHLVVFIKLFAVVFASMIVAVFHSFIFRLFPNSALLTLGKELEVVIQMISLGLIGISMTATAIQLKIFMFNLYDLTITQVRFLVIDEKYNDSNDGILQKISKCLDILNSSK